MVRAGGVRVAAEARGEMGDPAAGGALGPELPDVVVLEVGVAELAQGSAPGGRRCARAVPLRGGVPGVPGVPVEPVSCGVMAEVPSCVAAAGGRPGGAATRTDLVSPIRQARPLCCTIRER